MAHLTAPNVTANSVVNIHAGLSYQHNTYNLTETASSSTTIVMAALPAGARVVTAIQSHDNNAVDTTGGALVALELWTNGVVATGPNAEEVTLIISAAASTVVHVYNPTHAAIGFECTSSSNVVISLTNFVDSGTTSTVFSLAITYDCQKEGENQP